MADGTGITRTTLAVVAAIAMTATVFGESPEDWGRRLGDRDFAVRELATHRLREAGVSAIPTLLSARESEVPEVAARARRTLRRIETTLRPTTENFARLEALSRSPRTDVAEYAGTLFCELEQRYKEHAAEARIAVMIERIEREAPEFGAIQPLEKNTPEACLAHTRVALAILRERNAPTNLVRVHEKLASERLQLLRDAGFPADDLAGRDRRQAILSSCLELLAADVPDEAIRLAARLEADTAVTLPRFHGDLSREVVLAKAIVQRDARELSLMRDSPLIAATSCEEMSALLTREASTRLERGEYHAAGRLAHLALRVVGRDSNSARSEDPEIVLAEVVNHTRRDAPPALWPGEGRWFQDQRRRRARLLISAARKALATRDFERARRYARLAEELEVVYGLFDDSPVLVLADVDRLENPAPPPEPWPGNVVNERGERNEVNR